VGLVNGVAAHVVGPKRPTRDAKQQEIATAAQHDPLRHATDLFLYTHNRKRYDELVRAGRLPSQVWAEYEANGQLDRHLRAVDERDGEPLRRLYRDRPTGERAILGLAAATGTTDDIVRALDALRVHPHYPARASFARLVHGFTAPEIARIAAAFLPGSGSTESVVGVYRSVREARERAHIERRRRLLRRLRAQWATEQPAIVPLFESLTRGYSPAQVERLRCELERSGDVDAVFEQIEGANLRYRLDAVEAAFQRWMAEWEASRDLTVQTPMQEPFMLADGVVPPRPSVPPADPPSAIEGIEGESDDSERQLAIQRTPETPDAPEVRPAGVDADDEPTDADELEGEAGAPHALRAPPPGAYAAGGVLPGRYLTHGFGRVAEERLRGAWDAGRQWDVYHETLLQRGGERRAAREETFLGHLEELGCRDTGPCRLEREQLAVFAPLAVDFTPEQWARLAAALTDGEGEGDPLAVWREIEGENLAEAISVREPAFLRYMGAWGHTPRWNPLEWTRTAPRLGRVLLDPETSGLIDELGSALGSLGGEDGGDALSTASQGIGALFGAGSGGRKGGTDPLGGPLGAFAEQAIGVLTGRATPTRRKAGPSGVEAEAGPVDGGDSGDVLSTIDQGIGAVLGGDGAPGAGLSPLPAITFTSTRDIETVPTGNESATQFLLSLTAGRLGADGVLFLPNGRPLTGLRLRQLAIPDFCKDRWADLSGGLSFEEFIRFLDDFEQAASKSTAAIKGKACRIDPSTLDLFRAGGYQDGASFVIPVAPRSAQVGGRTGHAPGAAPPMGSFDPQRVLAAWVGQGRLGEQVVRGLEGVGLTDVVTRLPQELLGVTAGRMPRDTDPSRWWHELTAGQGLSPTAEAQIRRAIDTDGPDGVERTIATYTRLLEDAARAQRAPREALFTKILAAAQRVAGPAFDPAGLPGGDPFVLLSRYVRGWPRVVEAMKRGDNPLGVFRQIENERVQRLLRVQAPEWMSRMLAALWAQREAAGWTPTPDGEAGDPEAVDASDSAQADVGSSDVGDVGDADAGAFEDADAGYAQGEASGADDADEAGDVRVRPPIRVVPREPVGVVREPVRVVGREPVREVREPIRPIVRGPIAGDRVGGYDPFRYRHGLGPIAGERVGGYDPFRYFHGPGPVGTPVEIAPPPLRGIWGGFNGMAPRWPLRRPWRPRPLYHLSFARPMAERELRRLLTVVPQLRAHPPGVLAEMAGLTGQARDVRGVDATTGEYLLLPGETLMDVAFKLVGDRHRWGELQAANPLRAEGDPRVRIPPSWFGYVPYSVPLRRVRELVALRRRAETGEPDEAAFDEAGGLDVAAFYDAGDPEEAGALPWHRRARWLRWRGRRPRWAPWMRGLGGWETGDPDEAAFDEAGGLDVAAFYDAGDVDEAGDPEEAGALPRHRRARRRGRRPRRAPLMRGPGGLVGAGPAVVAADPLAGADPAGTADPPEEEDGNDPAGDDAGDPTSVHRYLVRRSDLRAPGTPEHTRAVAEAIALRHGLWDGERWLRPSWWAELRDANRHKPIGPRGWWRDIAPGEELWIPRDWPILTQGSPDGSDTGDISGPAYTVVRGDWPQKIAQKFDADRRRDWLIELHEANPHKRVDSGLGNWVTLVVGEFINIPEAWVASDTGGPDDTDAGAPRENLTTRTYAVVAGDGMQRIAQKLGAATREHWFAELRDANPQKRMKVDAKGRQLGWESLVPGEILNVPDAWRDTPHLRPPPGGTPTPAPHQGLSQFPTFPGGAVPSPTAPPGTVPAAASVDPGVLLRAQALVAAFGHLHPEAIVPKDFSHGLPFSPDITGVLTPRTQRALASFQRWTNATTGSRLRTDGVLEPDTIAALDSFSAQALGELAQRPPAVPAAGAARSAGDERDPFAGQFTIQRGDVHGDPPEPAPHAPVRGSPRPPAPRALWTMPMPESPAPLQDLQDALQPYGMPGVPGLPGGAPHAARPTRPRRDAPVAPPAPEVPHEMDPEVPHEAPAPTAKKAGGDPVIPMVLAGLGLVSGVFV
jgi:hypothetical protein